MLKMLTAVLRSLACYIYNTTPFCLSIAWCNGPLAQIRECHQERAAPGNSTQSSSAVHTNSVVNWQGKLPHIVAGLIERVIPRQKLVPSVLVFCEDIYICEIVPSAKSGTLYLSSIHMCLWKLHPYNMASLSSGPSIRSYIRSREQYY